MTTLSEGSHICHLYTLQRGKTFSTLQKKNKKGVHFGFNTKFHLATILELWENGLTLIAITPRSTDPDLKYLLGLYLWVNRSVGDNEMFTCLKWLWRYFCTVCNWKPWLLNWLQHKLTHYGQTCHKTKQPTIQHQW